MNPVVHFEMPAEDSQRMSDFYTKAFGWKTQVMGPEMNNYVVVTTGDADEDGRPIEPGYINGGFYKSTDAKNVPSVVIAVEDIIEAMKKVTEAGGKVLGGSQGEGKPDDIPGVGLFASIIDTEGNKVGLLQPPKEM